jgi:predicted glutamine amidotransferase
MCRLAAYTGPSIPLQTIVSVPAHSLLKQSVAARETALTVNGDGFGVCWYGDDRQPGQYRDVMPAWSDPNLANFCRMVRSDLFLAHIRASTHGETARANCHPFVFGQWSYMHNGQIPHIQRLRRELENELSDELYQSRCGTTDSELFFLLLLSLGLEQDPQTAWKQAFSRITTNRRYDDAVKMTCVLSDGQRLYTFRQSSDHQSPTLYLSNQLQTGGYAITSEPLDSQADNWMVIPENSFCVVDRDAHSEMILTY